MDKGVGGEKGHRHEGQGAAGAKRTGTNYLGGATAGCGNLERAVDCCFFSYRCERGGIGGGGGGEKRKGGKQSHITGKRVLPFLCGAITMFLYRKKRRAHRGALRE